MYVWDRAEPENDAGVISFWRKRTLSFFSYLIKMMTRIIPIAWGELGCEEFRSAAGSIKLLGFTSCSESNSAEAKPREDPRVLPVNSYSSVTVRICGKETWGLASLPSRAHG